MHRVLKRQLRRALKLASNDAVDTFIASLRGQAASPVRDGLLGLIESVEVSYSELERDLMLRTRSLAISSGELFELNQRLRGEVAQQRQAQRALLDAATQMAASANIPMPDAKDAGLQSLAHFLASLVQQRQSALSAQSENLRLLETVLEAIPLPIVIRDGDLRIRRANAAFEKMLQVDRSEMIGHRLARAYERYFSGHSLKQTDEIVMQQVESLHYESTVTSRNGDVYDVIVAKAPVTHPSGRSEGIVSVLTDISEQKRVAAELNRQRLAAEAATRAKSRFLANMSHELRTPLNGVVGMASLLETTMLDASQQHFVRTLKTSAEALITIINDILDLSKIEAGKLELVTATVDLANELTQVVSLFSARAAGKGIDLTAHIAVGTPRKFAGDAVRLRQILSNLVSNAVKFTAQGEVLVGARVIRDESGAEWLAIDVSDTGIGIADETRQHIFDAFVQADDSVTRRFGGTGLGLTICRELIALMRGSLTVESVAGQGSCFSCRLPLVALEAVQPPEPLVATAGHGLLLVSPNKFGSAAIAETAAVTAETVWTVGNMDDALLCAENLSESVVRLTVVVDACKALVVDARQLSALRLLAGSRPVQIVLLAPQLVAGPMPDGIDRLVPKPICSFRLFQEESDAADLPSASAHGKADGAVLLRGRVLVVEDNLVNQELVVAMLQVLGLKAIVAADGEAGVQAYRSNPDVGLILMDCQMPLMDGFAATRAIRAEFPTAAVPIIALTGNAMQGDRETCIAAGMDDYLSKPFDLAALRSKVQQWYRQDLTNVSRRSA